jgi:cytochrome bd-type quinol oxidase subunit 1
MQIDAFLKVIEASRFATTIRDSIWMFPIIESIHVISFTLVVGTIAVIDLRLLGLASTQRSFQRMASDILKWTWAAFALTVATGLTMFSTNATIYYHNPFFRTKMLLLVLAGVNMLVFEMTAHRTVSRWDQARSAPPAGKAVAILSLTLWIGVIFMGRIIGFTTHPGKVLPPTPGVNFDNFLQSAPSGNNGGGAPTTPPAANPPKK